jgi:MFS transporter, FHS family, L-fucose permease
LPSKKACPRLGDAQYFGWPPPDGAVRVCVRATINDKPRSPTAMSTSKKNFFTTDDGRNLTFTFILVTSLFLLWGLCNGMIDVMDKHFQDKLHLTKAQSAWVQFAHYLGYFLMALPAGLLARRIGYKGGIISGLLIVSAGGFWFIAATHIGAFWSFLLGVCIIAMGLTILETVANPYTTVLGPKEYGAFRINLAQSFNGVGWILGPIVGGAFFYSAGGVEVAHGQLYIPYVAVAGVVLVLAAVFFFANVPDLNTADEYHVTDPSLPVLKRSIWTHPHFVGGVAAQFFYVAAQAGIFSFFINYMIAEVPAISQGLVESWFLKGGAALRDGAYYVNEQGASRLLGVLGFVLFLAGRATGAAILRKASAHRVLGTYGVANVILCGVVVLKLGWISVAAVFLSFFFMSIMFPTIFALGIYGLGVQAKKASAFIVMAIMGGAIMPKLMGHLGDVYNMSVSFLMPLGCFALIALYGYGWSMLSKADSLHGVKTSGGH